MYFSEWQPEQYCMKLRAPRCSDATLVIWLPASRCQLACPSSLADATPASAKNATPMTAERLMRMVGHSIGNRSVAVGLRHEGQQDEEREIQRNADSREQDVRGFRRLQPEPHERQEHHEEHAEKNLRSQTAIADRAVLGAIESRQENEHQN